MDSTDELLIFATKERIIRSISTIHIDQLPVCSAGTKKARIMIHDGLKLLRDAAEILAQEGENPKRREVENGA